MLKYLPYELVNHIYSYDNSPQLYFERCIKELKEKIKLAKYNIERLYKTSMDFKPINQELNQIFNTSKKCKSIHKNLFTFKNIEFKFYKLNIEVRNYNHGNNSIHHIFYLSKKIIHFKKELLLT